MSYEVKLLINRVRLKLQKTRVPLFRRGGVLGRGMRAARISRSLRQGESIPHVDRAQHGRRLLLLMHVAVRRLTHIFLRCTYPITWARRMAETNCGSRGIINIRLSILTSNIIRSIKRVVDMTI